MSQHQSWVVINKHVHGLPGAVRAVCSQSEWDKMQAIQPCSHELIRSGFTNEAEAERTARGTSGDAPLPGHNKRGVGRPNQQSPPFRQHH
jgi:hypothetical protein